MASWEDKLSAAERASLREWAGYQEGTVLPAMEEAAVVISVAPSGKPDAKFCVELGFMIMLGKPVILVVDKSAAPVPAKLRQVADEVIEVDLVSKDPAQAAKARELVRAAMARLGAG